MNIYGTTFVARCPANGESITYMLRIHTGATIMVEDIRAEVESITEGYHEAIADQLCAKFGGSQRLTARHHGVEIETIRPHLAHWDKPAPHIKTSVEMRHDATHDSSCVGAFARARP